MTRRQLFTLSFLVLFGLLLYQLGLILQPFFAPILWAVILARLTAPIHHRVLRWTGDRRTLAALTLTVMVVFVAVLPTVYLITLVIQESVAAYNGLMTWVESGGLKRVPSAIASLPFIGSVSQELIGRVVVAYGDIEASLIQGGKALGGVVLAQAAGVAKNALEILTDFLLMLFTLFFLFRDGNRLYRGLYQAIPLEPEHKAALAERLKRTVGAVVTGTLLTAVAQGGVAGVTYALLGVPFPVFLGALSALLALLPVGGTALVWGPVALYLFWAAPLWKGIAMVVIGGGLVGLMDNVLQPWLIGTKADLPMLFLFFATVGGIAYFGLIGLFLGPIILGIVLAAFEIYREEFQGEGGGALTLHETSPSSAGPPSILPQDAAPAEEPPRPARLA